jgi:class 3 adenylate cyclase/tetratricopeptide (TPR) repeat protein/energy-coupling factor transporter ATP-binding protein EcfA2
MTTAPVTEATICPSCGTEQSAGARFCSSCGAGLTESPGRLPAEERRLATVLFADISGFTSLSHEIDPEDLRELVDSCMAKLGDIVDRYGGAVDKVIGDALMAVFGAPVAHEDDPERAVRAALEMQRCAAENAPQWGDLRLSVGVNTGEVFFAPVGPDKRPTVMGSAVNVAQRLQAAAPAGSVLVGELTARATRPAIEYEDAGAVQVKPGEAPLPAWSALRVARPVERVSAAPLIGRERELARLRAVWDDVREVGRVEVVTLFGPPGIGKTRLAAELAGLVSETGGRIVRGRSLPYGQTGEYGAFAQQLSSVAGIFETDPAPIARTKLDGAVAELLDEGAEDVASHLAALMGLEVGPAVTDQPVILFSARRFVEALGRERPTMIMFEDLHWAQPGLLDLVENIAARLRDAPVLVLVLARPELLDLRPSWGGGGNYTALELRPLTPEASERLAHAVLAHRAEVGKEVAEKLRDTAEGNPLFIEELATSLIERAADATDALPTSVKGIIAARLDALPPDERAVLLDASVVGKIFWRGALARLRGSDEGLHEALDSLESRDLIRRESSTRVEGDEEFTFKHMLIREVAYATLPKAVRRERHAAVVRFIEDAAGDRVAESATTLAYHAREAEDSERELHYVLLAAERVWLQQSVPLYDRALELVSADDDAMRRRIRLGRALANVRGTAYADAIPELEEILPELEGVDRFEALSARFRAAFWTADAEGAHRYGELARQQAERLGDEDLQSLALSFLAGAGNMDGHLEAGHEHGRGALTMWKPGSRRLDLATLKEWMSLNEYWRGDYVLAEQTSREAFELGQEVYSVGAAVNGGAQLAMTLVGLGRHEEAFEVFERVVSLGRELEPQPRFTSRAVNMWAGALHELFEIEEARAKNEEAIALGERAAFPGSQVSGKIDLAYSDLVLGEVGRAESSLPALATAAEATKGWHQWLWSTRLARAKAEVALAAGRNEEALELARDAVAVAERYSRLKYVATSRLVAGRALHRLDRPAEAVEVLRQAQEDAERLKHPPTRWSTSAALADALYAAGEDDAAEWEAERAGEELRRFADGLSESRRERFLASPHLAEVLAPAG